MSIDYTPAVARALEAAAAWSALANAEEVSPDHLLQALARDDEERPALLLTRAGLDLERWRSPLVSEAAVPTPLPLAGVTRLALAEARRLARQLSTEGTVASDHVVLALVRQELALRQALEAFGLQFAALEAEVLAEAGPPVALEDPLDLEPAPEQADAARVLDANANRAREALRVLEDYCRFVLDDAHLSGELKRLRHDLTTALHDLPAGLLLHSRDTLGDVGTAITTPQERERASAVAVAQANARRLQEALRGLEEFGKLFDADLAQAVEQLRYRAYTVERALVLGTESRERLQGARLYVLVTASACALGLERTVKGALAGGADVIQLREKALPDRAWLERARQVRRWTRDAGALFMVNDRPDLARLAEADGVHLGQDELPVREARRIVGPRTLIGVSTHDLDQVHRAVLDGASYLGVGPTFASGTKDFAAFPGLAFVRQASNATSLPQFVIGGVTLDNVGEVLAAGGQRVAVCQTICRSDAPEAMAAALRRRLGA